MRWRDYENLPFDAASALELATKWAPFKDSSLSLVCDASGKLRLVLRTRMPARSSFFMKAPYRDDAVVFVGGIDHELKIDIVDLVDMSLVDTLVTQPLSAIQLERLATWFGPSPPERVSFMTMEQGVYLAGATTGTPIRALVSHCEEISAQDHDAELGPDGR